MLFSGKENVFMCLDVFQKIFRKIFFGVWKMLQGKDKPISTRTKPRLTLDARDLAAPENTSRSRRTNPSRPRRRSRDREAPRRFAGSRSARSREASIAISQAPRRSRSAWRQDRHLGSRSTALVLVIGADWSLVRANGADWCFSLSRTALIRDREQREVLCDLSLSPEFIWSENRNGNSFP